MAIEKLYLEHKQTGGRLTADEFNKLPEKVNELVDAQNTEEERVKKVVSKNRPSLGQLSNVNTEVDELTSETCVLVWNGDQWVPMKLSELNIGQGGGGQQQSILYYLRAVNQSPSTTLSASKSAGECAIKFMFVSRTKDVGQSDFIDTGAYRDTYDALMTHYPKLKLNIAKWWIRFEDPEVKRICIENWDKDGDGELSMEEAAAVSSIGTMFANRTIKGFTELRYFTDLKNEKKPFGEKGAFERSIFGTISLPEGLTKVPNSMFRFSQGECVIIPSSVTAIDELSFNSARIKKLVLKGSNYIDAIRYWGILAARIDTLYVAPHLVDTYKQSTIWNSAAMDGYLGKILPLSEYQG